MCYLIPVNDEVCTTMSLLSSEVNAFVYGLLSLPDSALQEKWHGTPGDRGWQDYSDNLSDIIFSIYQQLRSFTVTVLSTRATAGPAVTSAHLLLAQHQVAYRDFQGNLTGVKDEELDLTPFEKKWSLRMNIAHLMTAECCSQGPKVRQALDEIRARHDLSSPVHDTLLLDREMPVDYGSLNEILGRFDRCHDKLVRSLTDITDEELDAPSSYWEDEPVNVRFRLQRFAWHLRSHAMQTDKIRIAIGHRMTDMDRLARLLSTALGEAEGSIIGAGESQVDLEASIAAAIHVRVKEVRGLANASKLV
jgi:hypothetical protein